MQLHTHSSYAYSSIRKCTNSLYVHTGVVHEGEKLFEDMHDKRLVVGVK